MVCFLKLPVALDYMRRCFRNSSLYTATYVHRWRYVSQIRSPTHFLRYTFSELLVLQMLQCYSTANFRAAVLTSSSNIEIDKRLIFMNINGIGWKRQSLFARASSVVYINHVLLRPAFNASWRNTLAHHMLCLDEGWYCVMHTLPTMTALTASNMTFRVFFRLLGGSALVNIFWLLKVTW